MELHIRFDIYHDTKSLTWHIKYDNKVALELIHAQLTTLLTLMDVQNIMINGRLCDISGKTLLIFCKPADFQYVHKGDIWYKNVTLNTSQRYQFLQFVHI